MKIDICTLFPKMFDALSESLVGKAQKNGKININIHNIRDFSIDKHKKCDDYPFGGGAGMLMQVQPIYDCVTSIENWASATRIYLSPRGSVLSQKLATNLSKVEHLILVCGHYEGIDQRAIELLGLIEVSIGDYVLSGGEIAAMVVVDCISRLIPGVLGNENSAIDESFSNGLLEYPQYTRPAEFEGIKVPEVLLSGNHKEIELWRKKQSVDITKKNRPDLL